MVLVYGEDLSGNTGNLLMEGKLRNYFPKEKHLCMCLMDTWKIILLFGALFAGILFIISIILYYLLA